MTDEPTDPKAFAREVRKIWRALRSERHARGKLLSGDELKESAVRIVALAEQLSVLAERSEARAANENAVDAPAVPPKTKKKPKAAKTKTMRSESEPSSKTKRKDKK